MPTLYSQALLACIGEGRDPRPDEVAALTEKIWREAYGVNSPSTSCQRAAMFAVAALAGRHSGQDRLVANV
jgi:hypothetical protein